MDDEIKTKKITFKEWYDEMPLNKRQEFRDQFLEETGLAYPSFYGKIAKSKFTRLEQKFILEYAKENIEFPN